MLRNLTKQETRLSFGRQVNFAESRSPPNRICVYSKNGLQLHEFHICNWKPACPSITASSRLRSAVYSQKRKGHKRGFAPQSKPILNPNGWGTWDGMAATSTANLQGGKQTAPKSHTSQPKANHYTVQGTSDVGALWQKHNTPRVPQSTDFRLLSDCFQTGFRPWFWLL